MITGHAKPDVPGDDAREPAFGMPAMWIAESYAAEAKREGFQPIDNLSVLLTHLSEVIRNNLPQLLSYKDMRALLDRLDPEYKRLIDDIVPSQISYSGLQGVLKLLLAERVSIRNLNLILEAIAEIAPHVRRSEQVVEHVRMRMAQQICGDLTEGGSLRVLRLGQSLGPNRLPPSRSSATPRARSPSSTSTRACLRGVRPGGAPWRSSSGLEQGKPFAIVTAPDAPPLRAHGDRAAVPDAAGAQPRRDPPRRRHREPGEPSREPALAGPDPRRLPGVLPASAAA